MNLYKTGIKCPNTNTVYWNNERLGYQAANQQKALAQAKLNRKKSNWLAVVEPVTELDLIECEGV
jgi:hypothetical protein